MRRTKTTPFAGGIEAFVGAQEATEILAGLESCRTPEDVLAWCDRCDRLDDGRSVAVQMVRYGVQLDPDLVADRFATAVEFVQRMAVERRSDAIIEWARENRVSLYRAFGNEDGHTSMCRCPTCGAKVENWGSGFYCVDHAGDGRAEAGRLVEWEAKR